MLEDVKTAEAGATPSTMLPVVKAFAPTAAVLVKMARENDAAPIVAAPATTRRRPTSLRCRRRPELGRGVVSMLSFSVPSFLAPPCAASGRAAECSRQFKRGYGRAATGPG
jgi:hypothetical protein